MSHAYDALSPELVLDAVESLGQLPTGHCFALNSYENRVYQIGLDDHEVVAKFYRPERWTDQCIQEEHDFSQALADNEIPVVAPWRDQTGQSLFAYQGFRYALFAKRGGRAPDLDNFDHLEWLGRFLGRIHLQGKAKAFTHRPALTPETFGWVAREKVLQSEQLPRDAAEQYATTSEHLLNAIAQVYRATPHHTIRLHGDCHPGNILWTESGPHFVDMDDCRMGPAVQDLWMLLNGSRQDMHIQLDAILEGYRMFCDFDTRELALIESLRALRLIHYTAWLSQRWTDPAFPRAFPWFSDAAYWQSHIQDLEQQRMVLNEPWSLL